MAHYYGTLQGQAGPSSRLGSKKSGIRTTVETWGCGLEADLHHYDPQYNADEVAEFLNDDGGMDILSVRFGEKSYPRVNVLTLRNPDAVAHVLDDPKIRKMFEQMHELSKRIEKEAPKALRRQKREAKRREREYELQRKIQQDLREGMSETERENWVKLCSPFGEFDEFHARGYTLRREDGHLLTNRERGMFDLTEVVNLTTGANVPEPEKV